jgi:hypothetical protein
VNLDLKFYRELEKELGEQLEQLAAELVSGKASDFSDYRYRVGRIRGVQDALGCARRVNASVIGLEDKR